MSVLTVTEVSRSFGGVRAVANASLAVTPGSVHTLMGPNGAGKTTLVNIATGHARADAGRVEFQGEDITGLAPHRIARLGMRRTFQMIRVVPELTVWENVALGLDRRALSGLAGSVLRPGRALRLERKARIAVDEICERLELPTDDSSLVAELPAGSLRMVEVARALVGVPAMVVLDEPAAGLTREARSEFGRVVRRATNELGIGVLLVEHSLALAREISDIVTVMELGAVIAWGTPEVVFSDPRVQNAYMGRSTAAFVNGEPS